jgi:hypothetical protein
MLFPLTLFFFISRKRNLLKRFFPNSVEPGYGSGYFSLKTPACRKNEGDASQ